MINLDPIKDSFFLGSCLSTTTIFTGKTSDYFNGHKIFSLVYPRIITLLDPYFPNLAIFSLNGTTPKTDYTNIYFEYDQSVMSKNEFRSHNSSYMLIITTPTLNVICECYTNMMAENRFSNKVLKVHTEKNLVHSGYQYTSAVFAERSYFTGIFTLPDLIFLLVCEKSSKLLLFSLLSSNITILYDSFLNFEGYLQFLFHPCDV